MDSPIQPIAEPGPGLLLQTANAHWASRVPLPVTPRAWRDFYHEQTPQVAEPWLMDCWYEQQNWHGVLWVSPQLGYFVGHFPGAPILPGVVQLNWCAQLASQQWPQFAALSQFCGTHSVKFKAPIQPNQILELVLSPQAGKITFSLASAGTMHSQGKLSYRA